MSALADDAPRGFVPKADYYKALAEIERLRDELADLKNRPAEKALLRTPPAERARWEAYNRALGLTRSQAAALDAIVKAYPLALDRAELIRKHKVVSPKCFDVFLWRVRQALNEAGAPQGAIQTIRSIGHRITPEAHQWLRQRVPDAFETEGGQ